MTLFSTRFLNTQIHGKANSAHSKQNEKFAPVTTVAPDTTVTTDKTVQSGNDEIRGGERGVLW
jgi:hypothetical protein